MSRSPSFPPSSEGLKSPAASSPSSGESAPSSGSSSSPSSGGATSGSGATSSPSAGGRSSARREDGAASSRRGFRNREGLYACAFWLGGQRYALDTVDVLEAITLTQLVPGPLSPPWLLGLTSLRGTPLPVVDLPVVLDLPVPTPAAPSGSAGRPALVLRVDGILLGGRVDRIEAVYPFEGARLEAASAAEHPAVKGLLEVGTADIAATLLHHVELARRVNEARFSTRWEQGSEGEKRHVATA
jgi:chemotaxis signal transduction protein